jgi:ATP adenylyltransferase
MQQSCSYCSNILSRMARPALEPWNKILCETDNFVVTPTVGALVEGWVLIISKRHVPAMGALTTKELYELRELHAKIRGLVESVYGSAVTFEHGPAREGTGFGCGIDHAHFHIVPLQIILTRLVEDELGIPVQWETIMDIGDLSRIHLIKKMSYLYISENGSNHGMVACLHDIPSQFMRRLVAKSLGIPSLYDYRKHEFRDNVNATMHRLKTDPTKGNPCLVEVT